jgi:hypothetical protein
LLDAEIFTEPYWICPETDHDLRRKLLLATTDAEVLRALSGLVFNSFLSVIALLDIAYAHSVAPRYQLQPVLLSLAPRMKGGIEQIGGDTERPLYAASKRAMARGSLGIRDFVDTPEAIFLEFAAAAHIKLQCGHWPAEPLAPVEVARLLNSTAKEVDNLRSGEKRLTIHVVKLLLEKDFCPRTFAPLLFATHAWEVMLMRPDGALFVDAAYMRFWNMHCTDLRSRGHALEGGNIPWPHFLVRRPL